MTPPASASAPKPSWPISGAECQVAADEPGARRGLRRAARRARRRAQRGPARHPAAATLAAGRGRRCAAVREPPPQSDRDAEVRAAEAAVRVGPLARRRRRRRRRRWPTPRPGCSAPGPGPTAPSRPSPAPTPAGCPRLGDAYAKLWETAASRPRAAGRGTSPASSPPGPRPRRAPTTCCWSRTCWSASPGPSPSSGSRSIVVLDGMSAAVGCELAEELTGRGGWLEAGRRDDGREPVLATVPSVTSISRTSLLTGKLRSGGQAEETGRVRRVLGQAQVPAVPQGRPRRRSRPGGSIRRSATRSPTPTPSSAWCSTRSTTPSTRAGRAARPLGRRPGHATCATVLDEARRAGPPGHPHRRSRPRPRPGQPRSTASATIRVRPVPHRDARGRRDHRPRPARPRPPAARSSPRSTKAIHYTPQQGGLPRRRVPGRGRHPGHHPAPVRVPAPARLDAYDAAGHAPSWWERHRREHRLPDAVTAEQPRSRPAAAARRGRRRRRALRRREVGPAAGSRQPARTSDARHPVVLGRQSQPRGWRRQRQSSAAHPPTPASPR